MGPRDVETLSQKISPLEGSPSVGALQKHVNGLMEYAKTRQPYECSWSIDTRDEDANFKQIETEMRELFALLSIDQFSGHKVLFTMYESMGKGDSCSFTEEPPAITGITTPEGIWNRLSDIGSSSVEFVNEYAVGFVLEIDSETVVALCKDLAEFKRICEQCKHDEDAMRNFEQGYSCEHELYDYRYIYWMLVLDKSDIDKIDWERGTVYK